MFEKKGSYNRKKCKRVFVIVLIIIALFAMCSYSSANNTNIIVNEKQFATRILELSGIDVSLQNTEVKVLDSHFGKIIEIISENKDGTVEKGMIIPYKENGDIINSFDAARVESLRYNPEYPGVYTKCDCIGQT